MFDIQLHNTITYCKKIIKLNKKNASKYDFNRTCILLQAIAYALSGLRAKFEVFIMHKCEGFSIQTPMPRPPGLKCPCIKSKYIEYDSQNSFTTKNTDIVYI